MRNWIFPLLLLIPCIGHAREQAQPMSIAQLKGEERAIRATLGAETVDISDVDFDAGRFEQWMALAENLARQGRVAEAIEVAYQGAYEIPSGSVGYREMSRGALIRAATFEERIGGPSEASTRAHWGAATSVQRGRNPLDRLADDEEPFAGGYLEGTIKRLRAIGRPDEAHALAAGALYIALSPRNRPVLGSRDEMYERDRRLYAERRVQLHTLVRTAFELAAAIDPDQRRKLLSAEALLAAGDAAGAETAFRALLASMPPPIVVSAVRSRATRGLARALAAQGGEKAVNAIRVQRMLLRQLIFQSWREDARVSDVVAELALLYEIAGMRSSADRLRTALVQYRETGGFSRLIQ